MNSQFIDSIAAFSKFGIENSSFPRDDKEWAKSGIDCLSSVLKLMQTYPEQNKTLMMSIDQISKIKRIARQCSVEKVVLFPYPNGRNILPLIRVYGGDKESFFSQNGWMSLRSDDSLEFVSVFDSLEKEYGVILYENT